MALPEAGHALRSDPSVLSRIDRNPAVVLGKPVIRGTRIPVELIVRKLAEGLDERGLLVAYPTLTGEDVGAAVEYAAHPPLSMPFQGRRQNPPIKQLKRHSLQPPAKPILRGRHHHHIQPRKHGNNLPTPAQAPCTHPPPARAAPAHSSGANKTRTDTAPKPSAAA